MIHRTLTGHSFRVVARSGGPTRYREWCDTVLIAPRESADVAFVTDNPGGWMIHCHILDHQESGMMGVIRVARSVHCLSADSRSFRSIGEIDRQPELLSIGEPAITIIIGVFDAGGPVLAEAGDEFEIGF